MIVLYNSYGFFIFACLNQKSEFTTHLCLYLRKCFYFFQYIFMVWFQFAGSVFIPCQKANVEFKDGRYVLLTIDKETKEISLNQKARFYNI